VFAICKLSQERGAAMRKQLPDSAEDRSTIVSSKHQIRLDDNDIREFLMDSHPDLQEDPWDSQPEQTTGAVVVLLLQSKSSEANLADPTRCQKGSHLSVYWKLFVQKRIFGFEQELFPLSNWKGIRN
jgi:hypothetical protein